MQLSDKSKERGRLARELSANDAVERRLERGIYAASPSELLASPDSFEHHFDADVEAA